MAVLERLIGIERRMNAAEDDVRPAGARGAPRVSSTTRGSPQWAGVAAATTYCQRGVMTATPNDTSLGLTR
jgi:hypothetical protein